MGETTLGAAVIGAGMAGRAHAAAYRSASTMEGPRLPPVRLVSIVDANEGFATDTARRFGFERADTDWQAIVADPAIHVVSVVVANSLHREIVEGLLAAGKHVLCEKPLASTVEDAEAMVAAAEAVPQVSAVGFTYRWSPAVAAITRSIAERRARSRLALQRTLLERLRERPPHAHGLAVSRTAGLGCPG